MSVTAIPTAPAGRGGKDIGFAVGIILILCLFFLPVPATMIDFGLAFSIALSVLILMVALWIQKPLEFSAFPTVLLVATILRLALNISTTRLILSHGAQGPTAAGYIIGGFARLVMGGDFVIGIIVFLILVTVNFLVITKGATRIAEVGARFTLDAIPGKQMAIDADLSAGLIDEKVAQQRRRELEEESAFFGSMDGASKFVRGDAIAGLIILAVNIFGGIVIGVTRHGLSPRRRRRRLHQALGRRRPRLADPGADRLARRRPAGRQGRHARLGRQGGARPARRLSERALRRRAADARARRRAGPALPAVRDARRADGLRRRRHSPPLAKDRAEEPARRGARKDERRKAEARASVKEQLKSFEIELCLGKELNAALSCRATRSRSRIAKMRRKFARQYGFVVPEIRLSDDIKAPAKTYQIKIHGTVGRDPGAARSRTGSSSSATGRAPICRATRCASPPSASGRSPSPKPSSRTRRREGFKPIDPVSVLLTHLCEVIHNNLAQLLSYKDMRALIDRLEPEYKRLLDDICPSQISHSGLLAMLKLLLAERVSIRNLNLILEAVAEIAPHVRRPEEIVEHVRIRLAQQICGDLLDQRRAQRAAPRQPLGPRVPPEPEARRQGRSGRVRHRSAPDGAIRRRSVGGHPQAHGRTAPVRPGHDRRDARLRAHDRRAHVPDAGRSCRSSRSRAASR